MPLLRLAACLVAVLIASACGGKSSQEAAPSKALEIPDLTVTAYGELAYTEPAELHDGVGIHAQARPGRLILSVRNRRPEEVAVVQSDLALITGKDPRRDLRILDQSLVRAFTPIVLAGGDHNIAQVLFHDPNLDASGMRLVYNNPRQNLRFYVIVD